LAGENVVCEDADVAKYLWKLGADIEMVKASTLVSKK
jgi:hypothetical protein